MEHHHNPVSTIYSTLENVPLILAPQLSALKPIIIPQEFNLDLPTVSKNDFSLERRIIAETERLRKENDGLAQTRAQKLQALHEERIRKQKEEARKIAPGFLDTDQKILTPTRASQQVESGGGSSTVISSAEIDSQKRPHSRSTSDENAERTEGEEVRARSLVHLFEESLPPRNPNSVKDDISILREMIVPSNGTQNYVSNGHVASTTVIGPYAGPEVPLTPTNPTRSFHPSPLLQPVTVPLHQSPNHSFTLGPSLSTHGNPELSPNNYAPSLKVRSTSSTNVQQRIYPTTSYVREHVTHPIPPTRPPKEVISLSSSSTTTTTIVNSSSTSEESGEKDPSFELIKEFTNMGFTKSQAVEALEKYNYDLHKATNYLLDMQQNY